MSEPLSAGSHYFNIEHCINLAVLVHGVNVKVQRQDPEVETKSFITLYWERNIAHDKC